VRRGDADTLRRLRELYDTFSEGTGTAQLIAARALLDEPTS
jgi:hypothetical protein